MEATILWVVTLALGMLANRNYQAALRSRGWLAAPRSVDPEWRYLLQAEEAWDPTASTELRARYIRFSVYSSLATLCIGLICFLGSSDKWVACWLFWGVGAYWLVDLAFRFYRSKPPQQRG